MLQEEEEKRTALRACLCAAVSAAQLISTMIPGNRGFHFLWFSVSAVWCVNHFLLWNVFQPHVWVKRLQKMVVYTLGLYLIFCIIAYNVKNVFTSEKWKTVPRKPFSFCVENAPYNPKQFFAAFYFCSDFIFCWLQTPFLCSRNELSHSNMFLDYFLSLGPKSVFRFSAKNAS